MAVQVAHPVRVAIGVPTAFVITTLLFLVMRFLVAPPDSLIEEELESQRIDIGREIRDENVRRDDRTKPERPEAAPPPPPPPSTAQLSERADVQGVGGALPDFQPSAAGSGVDLSDINIQPDIRIPPEYPQRAAQRGVEGYVVLCFDVTANGEPVSIEASEAEPSGYFERAAIRAVERWKYPPKMVNGQPVPRQGICTRLTFELEG